MSLNIKDKTEIEKKEIKTTEAPTSFDTHHDDVIHDAKVDFYGRRLATASSDRTIRIFQINEKQTETLISILSGHEGPVWQIAWAHPKFGSILASCSYDGSVIIWQEDKNAQAQNINNKTHSTWNKVKIHRVHDSSVNSIAFAPHDFGLILSCASSDGNVSILCKEGDEWKSQIFSAHSSGCNSVAWCPSAVPSSLLALNFNALDKKPIDLGPEIIATGGCDNTVKLWKKNISEEGIEKWEAEETLIGHEDWVRDVCWRPNLGQFDHTLISCSQDKKVLIWRQNSETKKWESKLLKQEPFPDTLWRVSFSEYGHLLAVSCGDNTVTIWRENPENGLWELVGNVNENVTETIKIDEPLAVSAPESAPIPEINFSNRPIETEVGYIKAMSPIMLTPTNQSTAGYQQFDEDYDNYQHTQIPTVEQQPFQSNLLLASTVIPDYEVTEVNNEQIPEYNNEFASVNYNDQDNNNNDNNNFYNYNEYNNEYSTENQETTTYNETTTTTTDFNLNYYQQEPKAEVTVTADEQVEFQYQQYQNQYSELELELSNEEFNKDVGFINNNDNNFNNENNNYNNDINNNYNNDNNNDINYNNTINVNYNEQYQHNEQGQYDENYYTEPQNYNELQNYNEPQNYNELQNYNEGYIEQISENNNYPQEQDHYPVEEQQSQYQYEESQTEANFNDSKIVQEQEELYNQQKQSESEMDTFGRSDQF